jgi:hypothetical protein
MKKVVLVIVVIIGLMQFIRPQKNDSADFSKDIATVVDVPENVQQILKTSCNDCHSNQTKYPWYSEIAPISWFLAQHVNEGKEHLNFSEWANYNANQKNHIVKDLQQEMEKQGMPLKSYLIIHKDAVLTATQYQTLLDWAKTLDTE